MHELSIATSLVELATDALEDAGEGHPVEAVQIRVGDLSGVVVEALTFCWDLATRGTRCEGARLEVERVAVRLHCPACDRESEPAEPNRFRCGHCDTPTGRIVAGRELDLVALELADPEPSPPSTTEPHHFPAHS